MATAKPEPTVYLYVIGPEVGPVKVGRSMSPADRVRQLQGQTGKRLFVTGQWPIGQRIGLAAERYAHWLLREKHIGSEWFDISAHEAEAAVREAISLDHAEDYALPALDTLGAELSGGVYLRTKLAREVHDRMHQASGGHHADFIREAVDREQAKG